MLVWSLYRAKYNVCFRSAGCAYELGGPSYQYVRLSFESTRFTNKGKERSDDTTKSSTPKVKSNGKLEIQSRVKVSDFNNLT